MRRLASLPALLTSIVLAGLGLVGATVIGAEAASAASPAATTAASAVTITVGEVTPDVVHPDETLTVHATITNTSTTDRLEADAVLSIQRVLMLTRSSVEAWATADLATSVGYTLDSAPLDLAPGASTEVTLSSSSAGLGLLASSAGSGPRGITVTVDGTLGAETGRLAAYRTYVLWQPVDADSITPVEVSVLAPVSGLAQDVEQLTAPTTGRLDRVLSATANVPGVTWAIDPALVVAARDGAASVVPEDDLTTLLTGSSTGAPTSAPTEGSSTGADTDSAADTEPSTPQDDATVAGGTAAGGTTTASPSAAWAARLLSTAATHEVWALPLFDTNGEVLAGDEVPAASDALVAATSSLTTTWRTGLTLPDVAAPGIAVLTSAVASDASTVVALKGYAPQAELTYTPTGRTTVTTTAGDADVLVADQTLGSLLVDPQDTTPATARQRILAELAVISNERPAEQRTILVALPRDWAPNPTIAREQLDALGSSSWGDVVPLSSLQSATDPGLARTVPSARSVERQRERAGLVPLSSTTWSRLVAQEQTVAGFAEIADDPSQLRGPVGTATLALASVWLEADTEARSVAQSALGATAEAVLSSQSVIVGSDVNLISAQGALPVTLRNDLDQPVTVSVRLEPDDKRLSAEQLDGTPVSANSEVQVEIPVRAVGSGDVTVAVHLLGPDGHVVASPATFQVRVRADWENVGTAVVAAALGVLLVLGIWRTIRRGRARSRTTEGPGDTTPDVVADDDRSGDGPTSGAPRAHDDPDEVP